MLGSAKAQGYRTRISSLEVTIYCLRKSASLCRSAAARATPLPYQSSVRTRQPLPVPIRYHKRYLHHFHTQISGSYALGPVLFLLSIPHPWVWEWQCEADRRTRMLATRTPSMSKSFARALHGSESLDRSKQIQLT